jgi:hypothetical protein
VDKVLPKNIVLKGAENHLYKIGLNLITNGCEKRSSFYNPLLVFSINVLALLKSIVSLLTLQENKKFKPKKRSIH